MIPGISRLAGKLRDAEAVTAELFAEVMRDACLRLAAVRRTKDFGRLQQLIQSGAWTDATLALLALEMPQWQVRRISYDSGQWHCQLSHQRDLPDWLDHAVAACHRNLCLAILTALVDAKRDRLPVADDSVMRIPNSDRTLDQSFCCENFA